MDLGGGDDGAAVYTYARERASVIKVNCILEFIFASDDWFPPAAIGTEEVRVMPACKCRRAARFFYRSFFRGIFALCERSFIAH